MECRLIQILEEVLALSSPNEASDYEFDPDFEFEKCAEFGISGKYIFNGIDLYVDNYSHGFVRIYKAYSFLDLKNDLTKVLYLIKKNEVYSNEFDIVVNRIKKNYYREG